MNLRKVVPVFISMALAISVILPTDVIAREQNGENYQAPPVTGLSTDDTLNNKHVKITQSLISMVNHNPELKSMLEKSIAICAAQNSDKVTNPVQSLEEYYDFIDWAYTAMPWEIYPNAKAYSSLYDQIDQSLNYFYWLVDQPLPELEGRGLYNNTLQYVEPFRSWMIAFTAQYGQYLNTEQSWNDEYYQRAKANPDFHLDGDTYEDPANWKTFNQFFARYLSSPAKRPVASPQDESVVVSPADSQPQGFWQIDRDSFVISDDPITIKSGTLRSVKTLLADSPYADAFAGGVFTHTFLDVNDYHRYHFPVSGTIVDFRLIPGDDAVGGRIIYDPKTGHYVLKAKDTSWQSIETRALIVIKTEKHGLVAVMPIAMSQVSSVNFEDTVKIGAKVKKGDMMGCFLFGGSDIIMLFPKESNFKMVPQPDKNGGYQHMNTGEIYGRMGR